MREKRTRRLWVRLSDAEYEKVERKAVGYKSISDYIRSRLIGEGVQLVNPVEYLRVMDEICVEMKRIGNNINQMARYVNQHKDFTSEGVLRDIDNSMKEYIEIEKKLNTTWRRLMSCK